MLKIVKLVYEQYNNCFQELADPRSAKLPLVSSPIPSIIIFLVYLKFVLHWGPNLMRDRKPLKINKLLIVYNLFQILSSIYIAVGVAIFAYIYGGYSIFCEAVHKSNSPTNLTLIKFGYFYFVLKIVDLLDTVFFILRKKTGQLSFLHIYHHGGMVLFSWIGLRFVPGGTSAIVPMINSIVHAIMYSYYLVSIITENKQALWWKKYLTQLQIIQFLIYAVCFLTSLIHPTCGYPKPLALYCCVQNSFFLAMFSNFYYRTYIKRH